MGDKGGKKDKKKKQQQLTKQKQAEQKKQDKPTAKDSLARPAKQEMNPVVYDNPARVMTTPAFWSAA